ncbi:MAG: hypothetical protein A2808_02860 [Candidatus Moranbacteria bacterium RIFCSPHIGHO2_01_FULL_55_24]|nr:MAG: hypothetical protein A2808_02860 [Candidatus Moranbacteria bacterium RIFCSPHIGHO2_01_FULL_55_24]
MNFFARSVQRILIGIIVVFSFWYFVAQVVEGFRNQLLVFAGALALYLILAYTLLPWLIHLGVFLFRRGRIPRYTHAGDGLLADPVNLAFIGTEEELLHAFAAAGWQKADPLNVRSVWKMVITFLSNQPYPNAPFSPLYLFARWQDYGFQEPITSGPQSRHHIRLWAVNIEEGMEINDIFFWTKKRSVDMSRPLMWVGAGSKDIGFGFKRLTYQISHAVDWNVDEEREHILGDLARFGRINRIERIDPGAPVVGKHISDGRIAVAALCQVDF